MARKHGFLARSAPFLARSPWPCRDFGGLGAQGSRQKEGLSRQFQGESRRNRGESRQKQPDRASFRGGGRTRTAKLERKRPLWTQERPDRAKRVETGGMDRWGSHRRHTPQLTRLRQAAPPHAG